MKFRKSVLFAVLIIALALISVPTVEADDAAPPSSVAQGYACTKASTYTDYHSGKPALYVYSPGHDRPIAAFYYGGSGWESVPNKDYGIIQSNPQNRSGDWAVYYISTRWRWSNFHHQFWNSDWRWWVYIC